MVPLQAIRQQKGSKPERQINARSSSPEQHGGISMFGSDTMLQESGSQSELGTMKRTASLEALGLQSLQQAAAPCHDQRLLTMLYL